MDLDDKTIRAALKSWLKQRHTHQADLLIADEVALAQHRVRADVVMVNGSLHGFEIKSPRDSLGRLREQAYWYSLVFDRVTLVSAPAHVAAATQIIPPWWEILIVRPLGDLFSVWRAGQANPSQDARELAQLLWIDEAAQLLERHGLMKGMRGQPRYRLHQRIAERVGLPDLREHVMSCLKARPDWRVGSPSA